MRLRQEQERQRAEKMALGEWDDSRDMPLPSIPYVSKL